MSDTYRQISGGMTKFVEYSGPLIRKTQDVASHAVRASVPIVQHAGGVAYQAAKASGPMIQHASETVIQAAKAIQPVIVQANEMAIQAAKASQPILKDAGRKTLKAANAITEASRWRSKAPGDENYKLKFGDTDGSDTDGEDEDWYAYRRAATSTTCPNATIWLGGGWMICSIDQDGMIIIVEEEEYEARQQSSTEADPGRPSSAVLWDRIFQDLCQTHPPTHTVGDLQLYWNLRVMEARRGIGLSDEELKKTKQPPWR
jgi:hypothetical protein